MERQEVVDIFHAKRVILRSSVYSLAIRTRKWAVIGMRSPKLQNTKRVHLLNNQTKTPNGVKTFTFIAWEPPLACLAWKMLITDGREVNKEGACLKISFISVLKSELWHLCKSLLPFAKGLSIYFYVVSSPSKTSART